MPAVDDLPEVAQRPQDATSPAGKVDTPPPPPNPPESGKPEAPEGKPDAGSDLLAQWNWLSQRLQDKYDPKLDAAEGKIQAAEQRGTDVAGKVVLPALADKMAAASQPIPAVPKAIPEPPVPEQRGRPFLEGAKEPLTSLINGLGLLAQLAMAGAAPVTALGALTGAMNGWAKGDHERADADFRKYLATVDTIRHENQQARETWEMSMKASGANQAQAEARYMAAMGALGMMDRAVGVEKEGMARIIGRLNMEKGLIDETGKRTLDVMKWQATSRLAEETHRATQAFRQTQLDLQERRLEADVERRKAEMDEKKRVADRAFDEKVREFNARWEGAFSAANDPAAIDYAATMLNNRGVMPQLGAGMAGARVAILKRATEQLAERGESAQDAIARQQLNRAVQGALTSNMRQTAQLGNFIKTAEKIKEQGLTISEEVDRTGVPLFNKWLQAGQRSIAGDPGITRFDLANASLAAEFARVMNSATGGGVSTVDARRHALELLSTAQTKEQYRAAVGQIHQELMARVNSLREESEELQNLTRGTGTLTAPGGTKAPPSGDAKSPTGGTMRIRRKSDGKVYEGPAGSIPIGYEAMK